MRLLPKATATFLPLIGGCLALACAPCHIRAQCPDVGTLVFNDVTATEGKPFQATEINKVTRYSSDGTPRVVVTKSNLYRDNEGRVRVERFYDGTDHPPKVMPSQIVIYDHCGKSVVLLPSHHTAEVQQIVSSKGSDRPSCEEFDPLNLPKPGPSGKFESLGHKWIEGVEVLGQRTTQYGSDQGKSSGAPAVRVFESWCSKSLDNLISAYVLHDKPKMEITTLISDVKQIEPDSQLFEIPQGYRTTSSQSNPASTNKEPDLYLIAEKP